MSYSPIDKPTDFFNSVLYTGNGSSPRSITGVGFQPDLNWTKSRSASGSHVLANSVSGANKQLVSNNTSAEATNGAYGYLSAFGSDGWTMTTGSSDFSRMNTNSTTYVSWNWLANGAGSSNSDGVITSTVSANTTAGFSIVKFTANGSNSGTIGHGLGSTPKIVIYKRLDGTGSWYVLYTFVDGSQDYLILDTTGAKADLSSATYGTATSSTISNIGFTNTHSMLAYCFNDVKGYSKFGSYVGNNSADGPFIYTGFKPAFVMIKNTHDATNWSTTDNKRAGFNVDNDIAYANTSGAEDGTYQPIDHLSNGFKIRLNTEGYNGNGGNYIYMAFAENPFVGSNFVPNNAR